MRLTLDNIVSAPDGEYVFAFKDLTLTFNITVGLEICNQRYYFGDNFSMKIIPGVRSEIFCLDIEKESSAISHKLLMKLIDEINIRFNVDICTFKECNMMDMLDTGPDWSISELYMILRGYTYLMQYGYIFNDGDLTMRDDIKKTNKWLNDINVDLDNVESTLKIIDCIRNYYPEELKDMLEYFESRKHTTPRDIMKEVLALYHTNKISIVNRMYQAFANMFHIGVPKDDLDHMYFIFGETECFHSDLPIEMVKYYKVGGRKVDIMFNEETRQFTSRFRLKTP